MDQRLPAFFGWPETPAPHALRPLDTITRCASSVVGTPYSPAALQQGWEERARCSFGIRSSRSPAAVVSILSRDPLRIAVRSLVRS